MAAAITAIAERRAKPARRLRRLQTATAFSCDSISRDNIACDIVIVASLILVNCISETPP
jgi:hypothetical protein